MTRAIAAAFIVMVFCTSCGNPLDILGPRDKPDFKAKDWTSVTVTYWIRTRATNKLERVFTVVDTSTITDLKSKFNVKTVGGLSTGTGQQLRFTERNGDSWHGELVFSDCVYLSSTANKWRSYRIDLSDCSLGYLLLNLCVQNERTFYPKVTSENIILLSNLKKDYPMVDE